jgi:excisionase family DNA binding protein
MRYTIHPIQPRRPPIMPYLTVSEATKRTPFSEPVIRGMIRRGELVPIRTGTRMMLDEAELSAKLGILFKVS